MPIRYTDEIVVTQILSFLDNISVLRFGMTSRMHRIVSLHAALWADLNLTIKSEIGIDAVSELVSRSSICIPLRRLNINCSNKSTTCSSSSTCAESASLFCNRSLVGRKVGAPLRVFVVVESLVYRRTAAHYLEVMNFSVEYAYNGVDALRILQQNTFDLVLMDVNMLGMNGLTATRALREFELCNRQDFRQRIIGLSENIDDKANALASGMDDFISKPFNFERYSQRILAVIDIVPIMSTNTIDKINEDENGPNQVSKKQRMALSNCCSPCGFLLNLKKEGKLCSVQDIGLSRAYWLSSCSLKTMLSGCSQLQTLSIAHNIDINHLVSCLSSFCPLLKSFTFRYLQNITPEDYLTNHQPTLKPIVAGKWAEKCSNMRLISLRNGSVSESSAAQLVNFPSIEEVDLSNNECLLGNFLEQLPRCWPGIKRIVMRDCTQLQEDCVATFAGLLMHGGCPHLEFVDWSCQWAFRGVSLLSDVLTKEVLIEARPRLVWREDQCDESMYFGIDPDDGIESIGDFDIDEQLEDEFQVLEEGSYFLGSSHNIRSDLIEQNVTVCDGLQPPV